MPTYIALLLGINVSGQKVIKMTDLKELFSELSGAGKETKTLFWFPFLPSLFISTPHLTGQPIFLCLPKLFVPNLPFLIHQHKLCVRKMYV